MTRRFTGWHMTTIMVAFFGVVIAVNFVMARAAVGTFGGVVVENSYVASQRYNRWLEQARAQAREGWRAQPVIGTDDVLRLDLRRGAEAIAGAEVVVVASHPLGRLPERRLVLRPVGDAPGSYRADAALPGGRWLLHIDVRRGAEEARFNDEVRL